MNIIVTGGAGFMFLFLLVTLYMHQLHSKYVIKIKKK